MEIIENGVRELRVSCQYNTWITLYSSRNPSNYVHYRCTATIQKPLLETFSSVYSRIEFDILFYGKIIEPLRKNRLSLLEGSYRQASLLDFERVDLKTRTPYHRSYAFSGIFPFNDVTTLPATMKSWWSLSDRKQREARAPARGHKSPFITRMRIFMRRRERFFYQISCTNLAKQYR